MIRRILLFLCLMFTCGVALSNVALVDEESGLKITMIGPSPTGSNIDGSGALSMELTVKNNDEQYYVIVVSEEGVKICDKIFSAVNGDNVKCSYDKTMLKHGDNTFIITIFSVEKKKIVLRTKSHFFYEGNKNVDVTDLSDMFSTVLEHKNLVLSAAGGIGLATGAGLGLKRMLSLRSGGSPVGILSSKKVELNLKPAVLEVPQFAEPSPYDAPPLPQFYPSRDNDFDRETDLPRFPVFAAPLSPFQQLRSKLQTRMDLPLVLKASGVVLGVLVGIAKLNAAVRTSSVRDRPDRRDEPVIVASAAIDTPIAQWDETAGNSAFEQDENGLDARELLVAAASCFQRSKRFRW